MATKKSSEQSIQVRIGISDSNHELVFETETTSEKVLSLANEAIEKKTSLELTDTRRRTVLVPAGKIAFIEIGDSAERKVGFTTL
jgi:hypothetical protein